MLNEPRSNFVVKMCSTNRLCKKSVIRLFKISLNLEDIKALLIDEVTESPPIGGYMRNPTELDVT